MTCEFEVWDPHMKEMRRCGAPAEPVLFSQAMPVAMKWPALDRYCTSGKKQIYVMRKHARLCPQCKAHVEDRLTPIEAPPPEPVKKPSKLIRLL